MLNLNSLFQDSTVERVNNFFGNPTNRKTLTDEDILSVIFACRAINNLAGFEIVINWVSVNRPKLIDKISQGIVVADSSLKGSSIDLSFKLYNMNDFERAFTLMSALDGENADVFRAIVNVLGHESQLQIFDFLTRMLYFKIKNYNLLKINGSELQRYLNSIDFIQEEMSKKKFQSTLIKKIKSAALFQQHSFQAARDSLEGVRDRDVPYSLLQIDFREACAVGNFTAAHNFGISMIHTMIKSPWLRLGFQQVGRFDANACLLALRRTYELLNIDSLEPFLISGTLLGMVREGKIFDHDKDFDIAVVGWEKQFDVFEILYKSGEYDLDVRKLRGDRSSLLPVRHKPTGVACDIFFMRPQGDKFLHNVDFDLGFVIPFLFSKFEFETKRFGDDFFRIPAQYEINLSENYGTGWRLPDSGYDVLIESPAIHNKLSDTYKALALDRLMASIARNDINGFKRKIQYLRGLEHLKRDYFFEFLHEFDLDGVDF